MEEAESLCSRVGIICAGRLQCLGAPILEPQTTPRNPSPTTHNPQPPTHNPQTPSLIPLSGTLQHLKTKFGGTFFIDIKIPTARHDALTSFVGRSFSSAQLLEEPWQV